MLSVLYHIQVEGKILVRLDCGKDEENLQLVVGCNLPGKWILHWGINYVNDIGRFASPCSEVLSSFWL